MKNFTAFLTHSKQVTRLTSCMALCVLFCSACVSSYEQTVQQGNVISKNMLALLQPGMSKPEVRAVLGTPLTNNPFNSNRWEYFYSEAKLSARKVNSSTFTLSFKNERLAGIKGTISWEKIQSYRNAPEKQITGGTIMTKPTQKKKGIFSGLFKN